MMRVKIIGEGVDGIEKEEEFKDKGNEVKVIEKSEEIG